MIAFLRGILRSRLPLGHRAPLLFLPWMIGLLVYIAAAAGIGLVMLGDRLRAAEDAAARLSVEIPADASDARVQTVLGLLRQTAGIASVRQLTAAETAGLLEPWFGPSAPLAELPVPRLIDAQVDRSGNIDLAALREHLASVVPDAQLAARIDGLRSARLAAARIAFVLAAAIAATVLAIALAALSATRSALAADGQRIRLMRLLGATDRDLVAAVLAWPLRSALRGGVLGCIACGATLVVLPDVPFGPAAAMIGIADWRLWTILVSAALGAVLSAAACARAAAMRQLARVP